MKKRLSKKGGFTLIELIVVIAILAILAILALIAIPRFAGFTDRAKIAADNQYAALVGNSLVVMIAAGDFEISADTEFTIADTGAVTGGPAEFVQGDLEKLVSRTELQHYASMTVTVTPEGDHSVSGTE